MIDVPHSAAHTRPYSTLRLFRAARGLAGAAALALLAACSGDGAGEGAGLAGPDVSLDWSAQTAFTVGGMDAPDWAEFGDVASVGFDASGNLYILDGQTNEVTMVGSDGEFLRTVGTMGEGPGEIQNALGMIVRPSGGVVIPDFGHRALVGYDAEGQWTGNVTVNLGREGLPAGDPVTLADGRIVSPQGFRFRMSGGEDEEVESEPEPEGEPIWAWPTVDGEEASVLYTAWQSPPPPDDNAQEVSGSTDSGGRIELRFGPLEAFAPEVRLTALPDGSMAVVDSTTYRIHLVAPTGERTGEIARPLSPVPVTDEIRDAEQAYQMAQFEESQSGTVRMVGMAGGGAQIDPNAMRDAMRARVENMLFYPEIPVIEDISADWAGQIWVQRSSGESGVDGPTDIIMADGSYLGTLAPETLRTPVAFGPGGLAAYIEEDEFEVETVRVVRIVQGG